MTSSRQSEFQQEHFDSYSEILAEETLKFDFHSQKLFEYFLQIAKPNMGEQILELGCGTGRYSLPLLRNGLNLHCVDISKKSLDVLFKRAEKEGLQKNLTLHEGVIEHESVGTFDLIFGIHFLHHCGDTEALLASVHRRIRPSGRAVFLEPNPFNPYWYPYIWLKKARNWQAEKGILKCRPGRIAHIFRQSGFDQVRLYTYGIIPIPLINRYRSLWEAENVLNKLLGLRWISAVQIISGVKA